MSFTVATNVVASWTPERQPTGTRTTRAKSLKIILLSPGDIDI